MSKLCFAFQFFTPNNFVVENLAVGRDCSNSSGHSTTGAVRYAVDGRIGEGMIFMPQGDAMWMMVDLSSVFKLSSVHVYHHGELLFLS